MEEKEFDYINMIPLIDVMLVLLTIVLMTSTFVMGHDTRGTPQGDC
jgi:biopolymer transport protein ExbD